MLLRNRSASIVLVALSTALLSVTSLREASAIRPFDGTDAAVAGEGTVEFELGPVNWIHANGSDTLAPSVVVNVGVARGWEISTFAQPSWLVSDRSGRRFALADSGLVLKRILREGSLQDLPGPSVAVELSALFPATRPLDDFGARLTPVVSQTWNGITAHLSASLFWTRMHEPATGGSLAIEGPEIADNLHPAVESTVGWERNSGRAWSGLAALVWNPRDDLEFDVGFRVGRSFGATAQELRAGLTWSFQVWDPPAE